MMNRRFSPPMAKLRPNSPRKRKRRRAKVEKVQDTKICLRCMIATGRNVRSPQSGPPNT